MRTIKFRGYSTTHKKWVYGNFIQMNDMEDYIGNTFTPSSSVAFRVITNTVGQFTGLHDKNGKEIYEGDVVNLVNFGERGDALVKWNESLGAWCLQLRYEPRVGSKTLGSWLEEEVLEVIGNIHDNPELLKGGEE